MAVVQACVLVLSSLYLVSCMDHKQVHLLHSLRQMSTAEKRSVSPSYTGNSSAEVIGSGYLPIQNSNSLSAAGKPNIPPATLSKFKPPERPYRGNFERPSSRPSGGHDGPPDFSGFFQGFPDKPFSDFGIPDHPEPVRPASGHQDRFRPRPESDRLQRPVHRPRPEPQVFRPTESEVDAKPQRPSDFRHDRPRRPDFRPERPEHSDFRPERPEHSDFRPERPEHSDFRHQRPEFNRPKRPDFRPERPERPHFRPERPDRPDFRPERPDFRPERPDRPENVGFIPERPDFRQHEGESPGFGPPRQSQPQRPSGFLPPPHKNSGFTPPNIDYSGFTPSEPEEPNFRQRPARRPQGFPPRPNFESFEPQEEETEREEYVRPTRQNQEQFSVQKPNFFDSLPQFSGFKEPITTETGEKSDKENVGFMRGVPQGFPKFNEISGFGPFAGSSASIQVPETPRFPQPDISESQETDFDRVGQFFGDQSLHTPAPHQRTTHFAAPDDGFRIPSFFDDAGQHLPDFQHFDNNDDQGVKFKRGNPESARPTAIYDILHDDDARYPYSPQDDSDDPYYNVEQEKKPDNQKFQQNTEGHGDHRFQRFPEKFPSGYHVSPENHQRFPEKFPSRYHESPQNHQHQIQTDKYSQKDTENPGFYEENTFFEEYPLKKIRKQLRRPEGYEQPQQVEVSGDYLEGRTNDGFEHYFEDRFQEPVVEPQSRENNGKLPEVQTHEARINPFLYEDYLRGSEISNEPFEDHSKVAEIDPANFGDRNKNPAYFPNNDDYSSYSGSSDGEILPTTEGDIYSVSGFYPPSEYSGVTVHQNPTGSPPELEKNKDIVKETQRVEEKKKNVDEGNKETEEREKRNGVEKRDGRSFQARTGRAAVDGSHLNALMGKMNDFQAMVQNHMRRHKREATNKEPVDNEWAEQRFHPNFNRGGPPGFGNFGPRPPPPIHRGPPLSRRPSPPFSRFHEQSDTRPSFSEGSPFFPDDDYEDSNSILGSGNFAVLSGGTFYDADDYDYEDNYFHKPSGDHDFLSNFKDFSEIYHAIPGLYKNRK